MYIVETFEEFLVVKYFFDENQHLQSNAVNAKSENWEKNTINNNVFSSRKSAMIDLLLRLCTKGPNLTSFHRLAQLKNHHTNHTLIKH